MINPITQLHIMINLTFKNSLIMKNPKDPSFPKKNNLITSSLIMTMYLIINMKNQNRTFHKYRLPTEMKPNLNIPILLKSVRKSLKKETYLNLLQDQKNKTLLRSLNSILNLLLTLHISPLSKKSQSYRNQPDQSSH